MLNPNMVKALREIKALRDEGVFTLNPQLGLGLG